MGRNFDSSILDPSASEIIGHIRINKSLGETIKAKWQTIRCPECGTESGKLTRTRAFYPQCLREFRIDDEKHGVEYAVCVKCGKKKAVRNIGKNGICFVCRDYIAGICVYCGKEKNVRKGTKICTSCYQKGVKRREKKA